MMSAGARACNGGLGAEPQRGPGAEPLIRGEDDAPESWKALAKRQMTNLPYSLKALRVLMFMGTLYQRSNPAGTTHVYRNARLHTHVNQYINLQNFQVQDKNTIKPAVKIAASRN